MRLLLEWEKNKPPLPPPKKRHGDVQLKRSGELHPLSVQVVLPLCQIYAVSFAYLYAKFVPKNEGRVVFFSVVVCPDS